MDDVIKQMKEELAGRKVNNLSDVDKYTLDLMDELDAKSDRDLLEDFDIATLLDSYLREYGVSLDDHDGYREYVPIDFDLSVNNELKKIVLNEAINKKIKIADTSSYIKMQEHTDFDSEPKNMR